MRRKYRGRTELAVTPRSRTNLPRYMESPQEAGLNPLLERSEKVEKNSTVLPGGRSESAREMAKETGTSDESALRGGGLLSGLGRSVGVALRPAALRTVSSVARKKSPSMAAAD